MKNKKNSLNNYKNKKKKIKSQHLYQVNLKKT